jgi:hypothetical protein
MHTINASQNGSAAKPSATASRKVLPFLDVNENSFRRLSLNSSWTYRRSIGQYDLALTLFNELIADWQRRTQADPLDLDTLNAQAIFNTVKQRLESISELIDDPIETLDHRQQLLRDLSARKPTKLVRQVREIVAVVVADAIAPLRTALTDNFHQAPFGCLDAINLMHQAIHDWNYPVPDFTPLKRFTNGLRALAMIERMTVLSPKLRATLAAKLRKRCAAEFHAAVGAVVLDIVLLQLRTGLTEFLPQLDEVRANQAAFRRNVAGVRQLLDEDRTAARKRSVQSRSSVLLEMETPDEAQLLVGIRDRHRCADRPALLQLFAEKLHLVLNETARQRHPFIHTPAMHTELLTRLPQRAVASGVTEVVANLLGDLHTVFTAVKSFGVRRAARELFERAAPLCSLSSRDHVNLNVEIHRDLIVRLPEARGPDDGEIAEQLRVAFRELQPTCHFIEDRSETEVSAVRSIVGYPIGIDASNAALLYDYAESAGQGHRPHLFGFLPDSPDGKPLPQLIALAQHARQP